MSSKWHLSKYNICADIPEENIRVIVNIYKGTCVPMTAASLYALSKLDSLDEDTPILQKLAKLGIITDMDEQAALEATARMVAAFPRSIGLVICPTVGCNFDCPYCFEDHKPGKMDEETIEGVVALAGKMLDASGSKRLAVTWFGGEPLLACDVIETLSEKLMKICDAGNIEYRAGIVTNGYLLDQETADMLERVKVKSAQITLDGIGSTHDATRHLAGGDPTFDRITDNLKNVKLPFRVNIRHNLHSGNLDEKEKLREFVEKLAYESGNNLSYYGKDVSENDAADRRGSKIHTIGPDECAYAGIELDSATFRKGYGDFCEAHSIWNLGIDTEGRLSKCWENVDKPDLSFGNVKDWDPQNPIDTASDPDNLTRYLNTAGPLNDSECLDCIWLPKCRGGCPNKRITKGKKCVPYKDDPESFARAVYQVQKKRKEKKDSDPKETI